MQLENKMHKKGKKGSKEFREVYLDEQKKSHCKHCRWAIYMPWYVKPDPWVTLSFQVTVGGTCFKVSSWDRYERLIKNSSLWPALSEGSHESREVFSGLCLSVVSSGREAYEAWDKVAPAFYAFRGIAEWVFGRGVRKWSSTPQPQGSIPHPLWAAMLPEDREPKTIHFLNNCQTEAKTRVTPNHVRQIQAQARSFRKIPGKGSIGELLFDSLELYAQAMDERIPSRALLGWWQLAEALTLARNFNGDTKTVVDRLAFICHRYWKMDLTGIEESLQVFAEHRKDIVHRGNAEYIDMDDCVFFKMVCDTLIAWLLRDRKRIQTPAILERIYKLRSYTKQERENLQTALKYV